MTILRRLDQSRQWDKSWARCVSIEYPTVLNTDSALQIHPGIQRTQPERNAVHAQNHAVYQDIFNRNRTGSLTWSQALAVELDGRRCGLGINVLGVYDRRDLIFLLLRQIF